MHTAVQEKSKLVELPFTVFTDWSNRDIRELIKRMCKVFHLGKNDPMCPYMLGTDQLENISGEKDLRILLYTRLYILPRVQQKATRISMELEESWDRSA